MNPMMKFLMAVDLFVAPDGGGPDGRIPDGLVPFIIPDGDEPGDGVADGLVLEDGAPYRDTGANVPEFGDSGVCVSTGVTSAGGGFDGGVPFVMVVSFNKEGSAVPVT